MQTESDWMGEVGQKPVFIFALLIETSDEALRFFSYSQHSHTQFCKMNMETQIIHCSGS